MKYRFNVPQIYTVPSTIKAPGSLNVKGRTFLRAQLRGMNNLLNKASQTHTLSHTDKFVGCNGVRIGISQGATRAHNKPKPLLSRDLIKPNE